jgi:hypothetical protein
MGWTASSRSPDAREEIVMDRTGNCCVEKLVERDIIHPTIRFRTACHAKFQKEAVMKHADPREIVGNAEAVPSADGLVRMSRRARLERWADRLAAHGGSLNALRQVEYLRPAERRAYRGENTPLTVAYNDSVLREEGLKGETLGEIMDFFELTETDAHNLFCDCHYHGTMSGTGLSARLRSFARRRASDRTGLWRAVSSFLFGGGRPDRAV